MGLPHAHIEVIAEVDAVARRSVTAAAGEAATNGAARTAPASAAATVAAVTAERRRGARMAHPLYAEQIGHRDFGCAVRPSCQYPLRRLCRVRGTRGRVGSAPTSPAIPVPG